MSVARWLLAVKVRTDKILTIISAIVKLKKNTFMIIIPRVVISRSILN